MTFLSRSAMQGLPRMLQAELEELDKAHDETAAVASAASETAEGAKTAADEASSGSWQPFSKLLESLSELDPNEVGFLAIVGTETIALIAPTLLSRSLGKGTTAQRPTNPNPGVYFDTTLAAAGKPVFWTGAAWVDATGTVV